MYLTNIVSVDISSVVLPPKLQKRGRPKGATMTATSKKKAKITIKTVPFGKKLPHEKEYGQCISLCVIMIVVISYFMLVCS